MRRSQWLQGTAVYAAVSMVALALGCADVVRFLDWLSKLKGCVRRPDAPVDVVAEASVYDDLRVPTVLSLLTDTNTILPF